LPSPLTAALLLAATGFSPFHAEERNVREGNERVAAGDAAGALPHYDAAEQAVGARAEIDYDRGVALFRAGKTAEAGDAFRQALKRGAGALSSRASQNLGNALAAAGDREGAMKAFVEALRADPKNEDARFDLEVLLRKEEEEKRKKEEEQKKKEQQQQRQGQEEQPKDAKAQKQGAEQDTPQKPQEPKQPPKDERAAAASPGEPKPGEQKPGDARPSEPEEARQGEERTGTGDAAGKLSRADAERILDAFRSHEKAAPLAGTRRREVRGGHGGRDW
jgi:Ca-activated chloride channel family protein